jgi:hypothetical protein
MGIAQFFHRMIFPNDYLYIKCPPGLRIHYYYEFLSKCKKCGKYFTDKGFELHLDWCNYTYKKKKKRKKGVK